VSASERLRGVGWIQDHGDVNQDLIKALQLVLDSDDNVNVRLAAIDALARFSDDPSARQCLIQSLEKPQSPLVRIALIEKLVPLDEPASKEAFRAIVADEKAHEAVRARARSAIELSTQEPV
jgi:HEAT repeat protein